MIRERRLTHGSVNCDLDNNLNFSPDGRRLLVDCRDSGGINTNRRLATVDVETGKLEIIYEQAPGALGVGAASWIGEGEIVAIHALLSGETYDFTVRGGRIIAADGSGTGRWLDSRNVRPPFAPGALRGGTHKHEPDASGEWVGFTYNDHVMKARGSDLRNLGVSRRGITVPVAATPGAFTGESFSVLLTAAVDHPRPGTDQFSRAEGDCWVRPVQGDIGGLRAFRGLVTPGSGGPPVADVFVVSVPPDIMQPGPLGPLQGASDQYPSPPRGAEVRRLTYTAHEAESAMRGVTGHLRSPADGRWVAFIAPVKAGGSSERQVHAVSPHTGRVEVISATPGGVVGDPRYSPDGRVIIACKADGSVWAFGAPGAAQGAGSLCAPPGVAPAVNVVVSPDSTLIAYNRDIDGVRQVFVAPITAGQAGRTDSAGGESNVPAGTR